MRAFRELLDVGRDFDLCCAACDIITDAHGEDLDVSTIPLEHRTVVLVMQATGIIGNGGFNYLFEGSFSGDPTFALTLAAFQAIKCEPAASAFQKALAIFPNCEPPSDIGLRLTIYRQGGAAIRRAIDTAFWKANEQIEQCLAAYIRDHHDAFEHLGKVRTKPDIKARPAPEYHPEEWELSIVQLPHWARVAFAARSARRVIPVFDTAWPHAPEKRRNPVLAAIVAAENSARHAMPVQDIDKAVLNATIVAGAALDGLYGSPEGMDQNVPADGNLASTAAAVAKVAQKAAETGQTAADKSSLVAIEAFQFALQAANDEPEILDAMHRDLTRLITAARKANWDDRSAVKLA